MADPYAVLGVRPDCSDEELAKAYKRLAKRYHPDLNPDNASAADRMGQINRAYDEIKRQRKSKSRAGRSHSAAGTHPYYYEDYAAAAADSADVYGFRRPISLFRLAVTVLLAVLLLRLVAVVLGETAPAQRFRERVTAASDEPRPDYYVFTHLYP